jgi:two-component system sensor histidine kinase KdpD
MLDSSNRRVAEGVDDQMLAYMATRAIPGPWPAHERLLALVSAGDLGERLVRTARRLADELNADWLALYVEAPGHTRLSEDERAQIAHVLQLAEELGAKTVTLPGNAVAATALEYARKHNVTQVIVGKPLRPRWQEFLRGSVVDQLTHSSGSIDVYVVSGEAKTTPALNASDWRPHLPYRRYFQSAALVALATLLGFALDPVLSLEKWRLFVQLVDLGHRPPVTLPEPVLEPTNLAMLYLMVVVIAALNWGRGPAILASVLSVLAFDVFFVTPYLTFAVSDTQYLLTFAALLVVGLVMSTLAARAREQAQAAQRRETETAELYDLSRDLTAARELSSILKVLSAHMEQTFSREAVVLMPGKNENDRLSVQAASPDLTLDESELAVADWVYRHGELAGRNTSTLPSAKLRYLPLKTARGVVGVLGVKSLDEANSQLTAEQRRLMEAFASQASMAIERAQLAEAAGQAQVLQATEKLQTALLNSISHDLRTPLVSITGALSSLEDDSAQLSEADRVSLIVNAREEAERLNRLVGNLLDMTRLEAGALRLSEEVCDVQDVISVALEQLKDRVGDRQVSVNVPADLPLVPMDFVLITRVLINLVDNAIKYSLPETPIEVQAHVVSGHLEIAVADRGTGIPPEDLTRVFDKFYRVRQKSGDVGGTGLGLSISKGIVEAHQGFIVAENREGGGTTITLALPLK